MKRIFNLLWMLLPMWLFAAVDSQLQIDCGKQFKVTARAEEGTRFVRWSDGETANPRIVTATQDMSFTAVFESVSGPETCPYSGTCGAGSDNVMWELSCDGVLTISGTGSMEYYCGGFPPEPQSSGLRKRKIPVLDVKPTPWALYTSQIKELRIEEGITGIGSCAFANLALTGEVIIPASVLAIGDEAFAGCSAISKFIFAGETPIIGYDCFLDCNCTFAVPCGTKASYAQALAVDASLVQEPEPEFSYSILSSNTEQGSVSVNKEPTCADMTVEFSAEPVDDFVFKQWSDGETANPRTILLTKDTMLTAEFEKKEGTVIIHDGEDENLGDITNETPNIIVEPGGELNVNLLDIRLGVITIVTTGSQSGQIHNADNLNNWRIFMEYKLNPIGSAASPDLWYAFAVPFEVDIENGITRAYGKPSHVSGTDFLILEYDGQARAETTRGWKKKLTGTLQPGTFYMIGIEGDCNRWLFEKKSGASMQGGNQVNLNKYVSGNSDNNKHNGWNGKGNTKLEYTDIDFSGCDIEYLIMYDNRINDYVTVHMSAAGELCVGQPFFVQAPNLDGMSINFSAAAPNHMPALIAHKTANPLMHLTLNDNNVAYPMYVEMHEDASYTYTIGRDVMRMDGGNNNIPKCWIIANDGTELSAHGIIMPETESIVPLGIYAPEDGEYDLSMSVRSMDNYEVELLNNGNYTATLYPNQSVSIDLKAGTTSDFSLRIRRKAPTALDDILSNDVQCTKLLIDGHMYIVIGERIYDAQGKLVK